MLLRCSTLGSLGPALLWVGSWCQPWCQLGSGRFISAGFPPCRNLLKAAAPGAVQGADPAPASPQPQNPGCAHRAPLPVSGPCPQGLLLQPALWGLPAAQGMLAPIPKRQGGPQAPAPPTQLLLEYAWEDTLNVPKVILQQGGVTGFRTRGHPPVGCKCHVMPQKGREHSIPILSHSLR